MQHQAVRNVLFSILLGAIVAFAFVPARAAADDPKPNQAGAPASPDLDAAKGKAQQIGDEIIVITKKIPKEEKPAPGPPAKEKLLMDEARERLELLKTMQSQTLQAIKQAEQAKNPAEAQVLAKDARQKAEFAEHFKQTITGPPPAAPAASSGTNASPAGTRSKININSGALQQLQESARISQGAATERDPGAARQRSNEAFGAGRAGAGGVTLYKAATVTTALEKSKLSSAAVENDRLVLVYDGKKILFPKLDPEFLAIAIRSVYCGEGLVKGTLLAEEDNAVVLRTGKEQYGDVAWKKEFLPQLPRELKVGQELALDLGPGVGALDLPEPSFERITYYGPLKGSSLGQVVQESDMVYSMFWYGTDWKTGLPLDLSKVPGYKSAIELDLENPVTPPAPRPDKPAKNWWEETVWFVWAPNEMLLELTPDKSEFRFTKSTMRVVVWSVRPENVSDRTKAEGEFLTKHFDDYGRAFPVLERLREAAKTLAVVRWLKLNDVPLDQTWAKTYKLIKVPTPEKVRRYSVYVSRDKSGKPRVEATEAGGAQ